MLPSHHGEKNKAPWSACDKNKSFPANSKSALLRQGDEHDEAEWGFMNACNCASIEPHLDRRTAMTSRNHRRRCILADSGNAFMFAVISADGRTSPNCCLHIAFWNIGTAMSSTVSLLALQGRGGWSGTESSQAGP